MTSHHATRYVEVHKAFLPHSFNQETRQFLADQPAIGYDGGRSSVPELPYKCPQCNKRFKNASSVMQHTQYSKCGIRSQPRMLQYDTDDSDYEY